MIVEVPTSVGELVDKITILEIKKENITDAIKQQNVKVELKLLQDKLKSLDIPDLFEYALSLYSVNKQLWDIEDQIRNKERLKHFNNEFIQLARSVYYTNDERARLKKEINILVGSTLIEEKQYDDYQ
jgi:hypothetical protein